MEYDEDWWALAMRDWDRREIYLEKLREVEEGVANFLNPVKLAELKKS